MKKISIGILVLVVVFVSSCVSGVRNETIKRLDGNITISETKILSKTSLLDRVNIYISRILPENIGAYWNVRVEYYDSSWAFINTIKIKTDNKLITLTDKNPTRDVLYGGNIRERLIIHITDSDMKSIVESSVIQIQLAGKRYFDVYNIKPKDFEKLKQFYDKNK